MQPTLEAAGPTALRDLRQEAPPVYAIAQMAAAFQPLPPLGRSLAASGMLLVFAAMVGVGVRAAGRAMLRG